jgi:hypothetical protein
VVALFPKVVKPRGGPGEEVEHLKEKFERRRVLHSCLNERELFEGGAKAVLRRKESGEKLGRSLAAVEREGLQVVEEVRVDKGGENAEVMTMLLSTMAQTAAVVASRRKKSNEAIE